MLAEELGEKNIMYNIAAIVDSLGPSQSSFYLIKQFNDLIKSVDYSPVCFYNNITNPVVTPFFSCMNASGLSSFEGLAISTSIETAGLLLNTSSKVDRCMYVWDLEWLRTPLDFENSISIFRHPNLKIIARSQSHKDIIENYTNKKVSGIVEDWKVKDLVNII